VRRLLSSPVVFFYYTEKNARNLSKVVSASLLKQQNLPEVVNNKRKTSANTLLQGAYRAAPLPLLVPSRFLSVLITL